jgi:unsaturated chondroitin disaccharide hydrolase
MNLKPAIPLFSLCISLHAASIPDSVLSGAWNFSISKLSASLKSLNTITNLFPRSAPTSGPWVTGPGSDWTSGFFPGSLWYIFEKKGDTVFRNSAQKWTGWLDAQKTNGSSHDVGFKIFCSYGNGYRLGPTAANKTVILSAAQTLSTRYNAVARTIDSWSSMAGCETIIDNMMNLELLLWAARNGGSARFDTIARNHAETCMKNHLRSDYSTFHVVKYDSITGAVIARQTKQGYADASCWSRGQAWAIYGFTMVYRYTKDSRFLVTAKNCADYYIRRLPADHVPYWDFDAPGIPNEPRDASSAAVAASGMLELSTFVGTTDSAKYRDAAIAIIESLNASYRAPSMQATILAHSTGNKPAASEVDVGLIYADYYFIEALLRYERYSKPPVAIRTTHGRVSTYAVRASPDRIDLLGRKDMPCSHLSSGAQVQVMSGGDRSAPVRRITISGAAHFSQVDKSP